MHKTTRVLGGVMLLDLSGLVAVLWHGVLWSRGGVAEMAQADSVVGPLTEGPVLVDPGWGLGAISAEVMLGLVACVVPGRRRAADAGPGQLPSPGWDPHAGAVHYWDGQAWTGHVQPR